LFVAALIVCLISAGILNILRFRMKFRLMAVGLSVEWFMAQWDNPRMWRTYLSEAPARQWPIWHFYAYRLFLVCFVIAGGVVVLNIDKLGVTFGR